MIIYKIKKKYKGYYYDNTIKKKNQVEKPGPGCSKQG